MTDLVTKMTDNGRFFPTPPAVKDLCPNKKSNAMKHENRSVLYRKMEQPAGAERAADWSERKLEALPGRLPEKEISRLRHKLRWHVITHWPGWIPAGVAVQLVLWAGLFLNGESLLRHFDPTAGVLLDIGALHTIFLALLLLHLVAVSCWLLLRLVRDTLTGAAAWDQKKEVFTKNVKPCLEAKLLTATYWGLVLLFGFVFTVLL